MVLKWGEIEHREFDMPVANFLETFSGNVQHYASSAPKTGAETGTDSKLNKVGPERKFQETEISDQAS
jgi:hypothetical protein